MINIVLCGGSGTRLWPLSRKLMPKQFIKLFDNKSLFQLTVQRNNKVCDSSLIVSNTQQYFLALDQLDEMIKEDTEISFDSSNINQTNNKYLLEPIGRNTAPAIALACMAVNKDEIVLVTPSDHLIKDEVAYEKSLCTACELANDNHLVTFGITPSFAEIGFGYIEADNFNKDNKAFDVKAFHEKPDLKTAKKYLEAGIYYWNSGMFCFKAGVFLDELKKYSPFIYNASLVAFNNASKNEVIRIKHKDMLDIKEDSIDYAVMEKSTIVKVVPLDAKWSDVGSFDALAQELPNDENNNLVISDKLVKTIGIKDSIIIDSGDALLVAKKDSSQEVKNIVNELKLSNPDLLETGLTGYRPWGSYTILDENDGYKVKRIEVKPHKRLSLQSHKHRNEHWIVIKGRAFITLNDKAFYLEENQSTYIKAGDKHRLENNTNEALIIIEAQVGNYTGEDDIKRYDDDFNREG